MRRRHILGAAVAVMLAATCPAPAQTTVDIGKISCEQWLGFKVADPDNIAIWLSGFYNGTRKNLVLDVQGFKSTVQRLKELCLRNPNTPLLTAAEQVVTGKH